MSSAEWLKLRPQYSGLESTLFSGVKHRTIQLTSNRLKYPINPYFSKQNARLLQQFASYSTKISAPWLIGLYRGRERKNVAGVFALERPYLVRGKTVILLDDVCDSGATLQEAGNTLITAGAQWVIPLTLAKTVGGA